MTEDPDEQPKSEELPRPVSSDGIDEVVARIARTVGAASEASLNPVVARLAKQLPGVAAQSFLDMGFLDRFKENLVVSGALDQVNLLIQQQFRDKFATLAIAPPQQPSVFENLAKSVAINFPRIEYPAFSGYAETLFKGIDFEALRKAAKRVSPRNLRGAYGIDDEGLWEIMVNEAIPFFLVPDTETVTLLRSQPDTVARRKVLASRAEHVLDQCDLILGEITDVEITFYAAKVGESIAAFREGQPGAAQALATNVLDSTLQEFPVHTHRDYLVGKKSAAGGVTRAAYVEDLPYVEAIALAPVVAAHEPDQRPDPPKEAYTRHGTTHRVTAEQYTESNSLQAIMLATSVLGFVQGLW